MKPPDQVSQSNGAEDLLTQRLAQSVAVIHGVVTDTAPAAGAGPAFRSQHDPDWWQATVEVSSVEKGAAPAGTMSVMFANGLDIAWVRSPKLSKGAEGIFLLQDKDPFGRGLPGLAVVDPLDWQPAAELDRVRKLLAQTKPK